MATKTIPDLPAAAAAALTNLFEIDESGTSKKLLLSQIKALLFPKFASSLGDLNLTTTILDEPHGLGVVPTNLRGVLVCIADDNNAQTVIGDELAIEDFISNAPTAMLFSVKANATNVKMVSSLVPEGMEGNTVYTVGGTTAVSSFGNFKAKIYASP